jgi:hypothetical protein
LTTGHKRVRALPRTAAIGSSRCLGTPDDYAADIDRQESKWSRIVEEAGAKAKLG